MPNPLKTEFGITREDGLPIGMDCARCGAATFRPVPNDDDHVCGDCWADDVEAGVREPDEEVES